MPSTSFWLLGVASLVGRMQAIGKSPKHAALAELGLTHISLASLAKREEELWVPGWDEPVTLPNGSSSLYLVKRVRDEAHRFAIEYHRELRGRAMNASVLDEIPHVDPKRKKALLKHLNGIWKLRAVSAEEIAAVPGVTRDVAEAVAEALRGE